MECNEGMVTTRFPSSSCVIPNTLYNAQLVRSDVRAMAEPSHLTSPHPSAVAALTSWAIPRRRRRSPGPACLAQAEPARRPTPVTVLPACAPPHHHQGFLNKLIADTLQTTVPIDVKVHFNLDALCARVKQLDAEGSEAPAEPPKAPIGVACTI